MRLPTGVLPRLPDPHPIVIISVTIARLGSLRCRSMATAAHLASRVLQTAWQVTPALRVCQSVEKDAEKERARVVLPSDRASRTLGMTRHSTALEIPFGASAFSSDLR